MDISHLEVGPRRGHIRALAVTTAGTGTEIDVSSISETANDVGQMLELWLTADGGDVWYYFSPTTGQTVDRTQTTQGNANQGDYLPAGMSRPVRVPWDPQLGLCKYLYTQCAVAGVILRISTCQMNAGHYLKFAQ